MADVAAGQVETALDREMGFVFDLLGDQFAQDELLGKVLGADDDAILAGGAAGGGGKRIRQKGAENTRTIAVTSPFGAQR